MKRPKQKEWILAAFGALAAYASIFSAFFGFIGITITLLISSIIICLVAIGRKRMRQFFSDLIGSTN